MREKHPRLVIFSWDFLLNSKPPTGIKQCKICV